MMTVTALVTIDGVKQDAGTLLAFAGTEIRGLQERPSTPPFGRYVGLALYQIVPYAHGEGETMTFKYLAFQIKLGPLPSTQLISASGASWTDGGSFSGIATQFDNPSMEVVLSASDTASSVSSQITLGTVRLNVVGSGVVLIEGEIANIVVQSGSGASSELQYQPIVAGQGYVSLTSSGRCVLRSEQPLTPARLATRAGQPASRRLQAYDPCSAQVWGDFNGDCQFLASDVLALSSFVLARASFEDGSSTTGPLLSHAPNCAQAVRLPEAAGQPVARPDVPGGGMGGG